jgi:hypothetical protein
MTETSRKHDRKRISVYCLMSMGELKLFQQPR